MTRATLIDLNPDGYNQGLYYYRLIVNLDRCNGICNTLNNISSRTCVQNKGKGNNFSVFNMIARSNESKTSKHISCKCKCKFNDRKYNSNQKWKNHKCRCDCKNLKLTSAQKRLYLESYYLYL